MAALSISAVIPSLLLLWYFYKRDVYPEPGKVVWATFGFGVLTVIPVLLFALPVGWAIGTTEMPYVNGGVSAFLLAAIPEEFFKFAVLYLYVRRHSAFDEPMDGLVYGVAASLGFATLENILYVTGSGLGTAVMRAVTAVPCHAMLGAIMGYYVGQAKFRPDQRGKFYFLALALPMLLHGLYDLPLMVLQEYETLGLDISDGHAGTLILTVIAVLATMIVWALRLAKVMRAAQLRLLDSQWAAYRAQQAQAAQAAWAQQQAQTAPPGVAGPVSGQTLIQTGPPPNVSGAQPGQPPPGPGSPPGTPVPPYAQPNWAPPGQAPGYPQQHPGPQGPAAGYLHPGYGQGSGPAPTSVAGWLLLTFGALLATGGGLMTLGGGMVLVEDGVMVETLIALILIGVLPLAGGAWMFFAGIKKINNANHGPR